MAIEQERRFLVRGPFPKTGGVALSQGYLSTVKERTVRVRTMGDKAFITVKGETDAAGNDPNSNTRYRSRMRRR